ncbi:type VII secretion target [Gordonia hongkongensis]|uniref:ESX-1 secretion-associated protein n=1 Tax=Gordonia hongkongensis TaxID=1701090 RepID=A0ABT6BRC3_9ACTN|nr:type VII secretion target [Gordonia hongkongensis]MDF6100529.1 hypothetical protein [Gordonia hongkongensis]
MKVVPARVRELGEKMRAVDGTVRRLAPLDGGVDASSGAGGNELAANLRDAARALDKVVDHHADRYLGYADLCMRAAESYENSDRHGAAGIESTAAVPATPGG